MRSPNHTQQSSLGRVALVSAALVLALLDACSSPRPTCWGTCEKDADCGSELSCDPTIGYCVREVGNPENVEACELDAKDAWVCAEHEVQIPLDNESNDESVETQSVDVRGTPKGVSAVGNQLEGSFSEGKHQVSWGNGPGRHLLTIHATTECPALVTSSQPQECSGRALDATLQATGGKGEVTWSLVGDAKGFTLDEHGEIRGTVTGNETITVAMADERNVRVETSVEISALAGCPSIQTTSLPAGCVESVFEWQLDVSGPNVELRAPTVIFSDDPARDLDKLRLEINSPDDHVYRLRATPTSDAAGTYTVGLVADNENALAQAALPFEVKSCSKDSRVVCCDEEVTVNLGPGEWSLTSPGNNPLRTNVAILGENQLSFKRNGLGNGSYTLNLNNPSGDSESLLLLLSSPGAEGCADDEAIESGDAGQASSSIDGADAGWGSSPPAPPKLPDGCVGKPYSAIYDWGSTLQAAPTMTPDIGLDLQVAGSSVVVSGTPTSAPLGRITLTANGVAREFDLVLRTECGFAYTAYSSGKGNTLYIGSLETGRPVVRAIEEFLPSTHEVSEFRLAPLGERILVWTRPTSGTTGDQLFLLGPDGTSPVGVSLSTDPFEIEDAAWSPDGSAFSVIYDTAIADAGDPARYFAVVNPSQTQPWTIQKPLPRARTPIWPSNDLACVVAAANVGQAGFEDWEGTACVSITTGDLTQPLGNDAAMNQSVQARTFDSGLLIVNPDTEEFRFWVPPQGPIMHLAHFATPSGQYVARQLEGGTQTGIRIAPSTEDSFVETSSIRLVPDCDAVYSWSGTGDYVACLSDNALLLVDLTRPETATATLDSVNDYKTTRRSMFTLGDRFYVFHSNPDEISYVDLSPPTDQWQIQTLALHEDEPSAFMGIESAGAENKIIVQGNGLHTVQLPSGTTPQTKVTNLSGSVAPLENFGCVREFKYIAFRNWCGGDDAHRRFLPSTDGQSVLYVSETGHLVYVDTLDGSKRTELDGGLVLCDEQVTTCRAFAFGIK